MPTTSNFGWTTPADTDLVKDGAAAIRTLGNGIDTSLVDLKGGTTGQVLSKASNTDLDYTWVTTDDANAIQNAIVDAKGDLIAASANDTPARLAAGNNGETLVADSSATTGLRWTAGNPQGNPVINSAFQVWQRGTSIASTTGSDYTADRWQVNSSGNANRTVSRQTTSDTTNLPNIQYCARIQRNNGTTNTTNTRFYNQFETINTIPLAGKTVTFSWYARKSATYSGTQIIYSMQYGTGTDQNYYSGYTGNATIIYASSSPTTTWARYQTTQTIPTTATELAIGFEIDWAGTAGASDYVEITGVQIDVGSTALPFRTYSATLAGELAACQRYYFRQYPGAANGRLAMGMNNSTTASAQNFILPVTMRVAPTALDFSGLQILEAGVAFYTITAMTLNSGSSVNVAGLETTVASGQTAQRPSFITGTATTSYIGISAEL